jgi:class IV lanthipeptide synthase
VEEPGSQVWVERTVRRAVGADYSVTGGSVWLVARPSDVSLPDHGWKLHISSRMSNFPALVEKLLPLLVAERCLFKLARSREVLRDLNSGLSAPATVGKAVTLYPAPDRVREFGLSLAHALRGHQGPRVLSDRRVLANAPVYYRYGSFVATIGHDRLGRPEIRLHGPDGEEFDGLAGLTYRQPGWAADPFAGLTTAKEGDGLLVGGRFRISAGLKQAAQGNVYRAVDTRDGSPVVVKQARAHVAEFGERNDSRLRLRNERRVLGVLDGVRGVPRFVDHFRHGEDEFLVTSDCGPRSLTDDVTLHGPYGVGTGSRGMEGLATDLARVLLALHERGVTMRDLTPNNIVVGEGPGQGPGEGTSLIDFGYAAHAGLHLAGSTKGYAPARQLRDEDPRDTDDLHALGMVLVFAVTGLHPVTVGEDPELPRTRALQAIRRRFGREPSGVTAAIVELLSGDAERARTAVGRLAAGEYGTTSTISVPACPEVTPAMAAELTDRLLDDLLAGVDRVLAAPENTLAANDASIYTGGAGVGMELLAHVARRPEVAPKISELAEFTVRVAERTGRPPGLFGGSTGTDIFLWEAAERGLGAADWSGRGLPPPEWDAIPCDLIDGQAGVGLGHLYLHRLGGAPDDLDVAKRCAAAIAAEPPPERTTVPGEADAGLGRAHGLAGAVSLLLGVAEVTGAAELLDTAAHRARHLAELAKALVAEARDPAAEPMTASWCRGLTGIGQTLLEAGAALRDEAMSRLARDAADVCVGRVPRLSSLGQCCGAAGVGGFLLDVAVADRSERHWQGAFDVATHLLLRSAGTPERPVLAKPRPSSPTTTTLSWAQGLAGVTAFFRRLAGEGAGASPIFR